VEDVAKEGEILGREQQVRVTIQALEPQMVQGDGQRLKQLLRNLVDNGIKYTPPGGQVTLALRTVIRDGAEANPKSGYPLDVRNPKSAELAGRWAEIEVRDTGIGIPPEALNRIFDRFYRVDPSRSRESRSAGLGLCIAKTIAEAHGGRIEVQSAHGAGSTFTVFLPLPA
jgi:signal transduction histidine kinase